MTYDEIAAAIALLTEVFPAGRRVVREAGMSLIDGGVKMKPHDNWTTLLDPQLTEQFALGKAIHTVWFLPLSENMLGCFVGLLIPECELQNTYATPNSEREPLIIISQPKREPLLIISRPKWNKSVRQWLRTACKIATEEVCPISFACDTHEQAEHTASMAAKRLPNHRRAALERMYRSETRTLKGLS